QRQVIVTDESWAAASAAPDGWHKPDFDDADWARSHSFGEMGMNPWGNVFAVARREPGPVSRATDPDALELPEGFKAELIHDVAGSQQGSWVSLTVDDQGRLIASDQGGKGLFRITPPPVDGRADQTKVEPLDLPISQAQGLLYAFDSLYIVVNGNAAQGAGFYRAQDTNGDDQFDELELLRKFSGGGEHGPHSVILSPDGESIYIVAGNHTQVPDPEHSRVPRNWEEDQLLQRMPDAGGHASGVMAPGGWIARTDPDGEEFELIASGFRNPYDIAFNHAGDLFTFDADMEWDIGSPWYRPVRVNHAVSGAEFGWRHGTGKWPAYYEDSLGSVIDLGVGSPTGITFGYGTDFPAKYQHALFICDWSFGELYAVHIEPDGASYTAEYEVFAQASPLPLTGIRVNPHDGALYFAIGGRGTQSGLYRVTYVGEESTAPADPPTLDPKLAELHQTRQILESFHGEEDENAIETAWPYLGHADRSIRYAARIAVEHQPVEHWQSRALAEENPAARITAMIALARNGEEDAQADVIAALNEIDYADLREPQKLALLRAYQLAFIRMGRPDAAMRDAVWAKLSPSFPAPTRNQNYELSRLLVYLAQDDASKSASIIERTLPQLGSAPTQEEQIHYALVLRTLPEGWDAEQRRAYFGWFNEAAAYRGGASFSGFLNNIRNAALAHVDDAEKEALAEILEGAETPQLPGLNAGPREHVRNWDVDGILEAIDGQLQGRDYQNGRRMFGVAQCYACHRFAGEGGAAGPDLTVVANRFSPRDLATKITQPNLNVSDQYRNTIFTMQDGSQVIGRVANLNGNTLNIVTNPLAPGDFTNINRDEVIMTLESPISPMMPGLVNTLDEEELRDLMAFIISGGDPDHEVFQE
ncbi:MAG: c-type cytochrome, partial [Phycisphaeraceae bacterium]